MLYSFGSDNCEGELGQGDLIPRLSPTIIDSLRTAGEKIVAVDCGFKHAICKSSLGRVYTWGWGGRGQLGHGTLNSENFPRLLNFATSMKNKAIQVQAAFRCSLILMEDKKIYWFGTSGSIKQQSLPVRMPFGDNVKILYLI